jgi:hypothetical protein
MCDVLGVFQYVSLCGHKIWLFMHFSSMHATWPYRLVLFCLFILIIFGEQYRFWSSKLCNFLRPPLTSRNSLRPVHEHLHIFGQSYDIHLLAPWAGALSRSVCFSGSLVSRAVRWNAGYSVSLRVQLRGALLIHGYTEVQPALLVAVWLC